jgi:DNA modification methylase
LKPDKVELFDENGESRGFYSGKNRLNELTGKEWLYWSKSVINKPYPVNLQHKLRSKHGAQKPPELCADIIKIFTKTGDNVLDPFAGVGGTLIGASLCNRNALGIEINGEWLDIYKSICKLEKIKEQKTLMGDCSEILVNLVEKGYETDFVLTDIPYWNMDKLGKSKGKYIKTGEPTRENRKSKLTPFNNVEYISKEQWLSMMEKIFKNIIRLVKKNKYLAVFIGDMYRNGEYHFLTADMANILKKSGLTMKANIVWYDVSKALHIYGYLYEYIPSFIHQNVLIFKKEF